MTRFVMTLDLRDDPAAVAEYRRHHAEVWPEVVRSFTAVGVRHLDLYLLGRRLVMILEIQDGLALDDVLARHLASGPRVAEWERLMKTFQQPAPGAPEGAWWTPMERVFSLEARSDRAEPVNIP